MRVLQWPFMLKIPGKIEREENFLNLIKASMNNLYLVSYFIVTKPPETEKGNSV